MELGTGQAQSQQGWGAPPVTPFVVMRMWWRGSSRADLFPKECCKQRVVLGSKQFPGLDKRNVPWKGDRVHSGNKEMQPHRNQKQTRESGSSISKQSGNQLLTPVSWAGFP